MSDKSEESLFWGFAGKLSGQNHLGKLLEKVRQSIHDESEMEQWMSTQFDLVESKKKLPSINLEVFKDGQLIESICLEGKNSFLFGSN